MLSFFQFGRRGVNKQHQDEQRRVMALNVAGQIHQQGLAQNAVSVDKLLDTARQVELYVSTGSIALMRTGNVQALVRPNPGPAA